MAVKPREDEDPENEWRVYSDGVGKLVTFCPECAEREFGSGLDSAEGWPFPVALLLGQMRSRLAQLVVPRAVDDVFECALGFALPPFREPATLAGAT